MPSGFSHGRFGLGNPPIHTHMPSNQVIKSDPVDTAQNPNDESANGCVICGKALASISWVFRTAMSAPDSLMAACESLACFLSPDSPPSRDVPTLALAGCPACALHRNMLTDANFKDVAPGKNPDTADMHLFKRLCDEVWKHLKYEPVTVTLGNTRPSTSVMPGANPLP